LGPNVQAFEKEAADYLGVAHAITCANGTDALHLALLAACIGPGDEVICADINWIASAAPVTYLGAAPVLVDVLPESWCLDPAKVEAALKSGNNLPEITVAIGEKTATALKNTGCQRVLIAPETNMQSLADLVCGILN
jgi:dTDP-4-amino-4,6-dideoxygalactose transaminase